MFLWYLAFFNSTYFSLSFYLFCMLPHLALTFTFPPVHPSTSSLYISVKLPCSRLYIKLAQYKNTGWLFIASIYVRDFKALVSSYFHVVWAPHSKSVQRGEPCFVNSVWCAVQWCSNTTLEISVNIDSGRKSTVLMYHPCSPFGSWSFPKRLPLTQQLDPSLLNLRHLTTSQHSTALPGATKAALTDSKLQNRIALNI